jgi:TIR domain
MSDIFVSYSSADFTKVKTIVEALEQRGWSVWWDHHILAGKTWDETLAVELAAARCVLVLWSKSSVQSEWVRTEAHEAKERKILVPALLDNVEIPFGFKLLQTIKLVDWAVKSESVEANSLVSAISDVLSANPSPIHAKGSARERAGKILESAVQRRTYWLMTLAASLVLICGLLISWYFINVRPVFRVASSLGLAHMERGKYSSDENERLGARIRNAHQSIRLLLPNAYSMSQTFREDFTKFFETDGTSMQVVFASPDSDFYKEMTQITLGNKWQEKDLETNKGFVGASKQRLLDAAKQDEKRIEFRYFDTQFRVPIIIIDDKYCFLTLRLPPNEGGESPRLEFEGEDSFVKTCKSHFQGIWNASGPTPLSERP